MLPDLIARAVVFVLNGALTALAYIIPDSALNGFSGAVAILADIMKFTPVTFVFGLMGLWFVVDTALNTYAFLWNTYRLLPAKFT